VAILAAASVSVAAVLPREHVHEEGSGHPHVVIHRHFDGSAHPSEAWLDHPNDNHAVRYIESVFTKLPRYHVAPPVAGRALSLAPPDGRFEAHVEAPDAHPIRGAPLRSAPPRAPPFRLALS
jgi:hypothetical protein